jgi:hypothetical protein
MSAADSGGRNPGIQPGSAPPARLGGPIATALGALEDSTAVIAVFLPNDGQVSPYEQVKRRQPPASGRLRPVREMIGALNKI